MILNITDNVSDSFESKSTDTQVTVGIDECDGDARLVLVIEKNSGAHEEIDLAEMRENDIYTVSFDAVNYAVYNDAVSFRITAHGAALREVKVICGDERPDFDCEEQPFCENVLVSPGGCKFNLGVTDAGEMFLTPHVPKKTLFVGNSLLLGMGGYGMCSSSPRNDYAHYVSEAILNFNPKAEFERVHGSVFEQSTSEEEFFANWDKIPNPYTGRPACESFTYDLDLIIIQLNDNINTDAKLKTFAACCDGFVRRIRRCSPKARIIWVEGWFNHSYNSRIIYDLCNRWRIPVVCIADLRCAENEAVPGTKYVAADGTEDTVKDAWITHPGNGGMRAIADRIITKLDL